MVQSVRDGVLYRNNNLHHKEVEEMNVGENIRKIRLNKNIQQVELAEKVGVTQAMICQIERGTKNPSLQVAYLIAEALECKTEDFLKG